MSQALRVILDDRPLRRTLTGVGNYIAQLLLHGAEFAPTVRIDPFVFSHIRKRDWRSILPPPAPAADDARMAENPSDVGGGRKPWWIRNLIQTGYGIAFRFRTRGRYDLYHEPNHIPVRCSLPTVTTVHDLSVLVHPEWHPADRVRWYERDFHRGVQQTRCFLAASEFTKREMIYRLHIPADRIHVTYQAARDAFRPLPDERVAAFRRSWELPERFLLFVGTLEPRKNVVGLLDAYAALPDALRRQAPLVIAGAWGWKAEQLQHKLAERSLAGQVRLLGYLHDPQLALLYNACTALVWPSFYEGFGLPPLEALACGARVIVSNAASLPEVVGTGGTLLDPANVTAWSHALHAAIDEPAEQWKKSGRPRALAQAGRFTWRQFVESTVRGYRAALA